MEGPEHPWLIDGGVVQRKFSTYRWTGKDWKAFVAEAPPIRNGQAVAYDPVRMQFVLFGGFTDSTVFGDTWLMPGAGGPWGEIAP